MSTVKNLLALGLSIAVLLVLFGLGLKVYWRLFMFGWGLV